ncbi:Proclotting enzyme [Sarcoptes scabiei]|uniref:Proclotting enzyme n=1 Tax=Sarcoptes scabiei TaxID=52283 RepID=A0A131ZZG8_SARSC|nr:Proclotting enzyme [Sarcoptes scabiei]KPM04258.1 serine protease [Sarcoptes scabiei]
MIISILILIILNTLNTLFFVIGSKDYYPSLYKSKFNKIRHITLKDDAFCEAYQEFKDNNCVAKLTFCSPLTDDQILKMRQILCGLKFNPDVQPPPHIHQPPDVINVTDTIILNEHPPPYFLDVHPAQPNSFPWLAAIFNSERKFICSGALVAPKTVITSAQCVSGAGESQSSSSGDDSVAESESEKLQSAANFFVRFGRHNLNLSSVYDKAYEYDVESVEISPQFDKNSLENDFAILKLVSPVCNIEPIPLPRRDDWENGYYFGNRARVLYAGWGLGHYQNPYLRSLTAHLIPKDTCAKKFNWAPDQLSTTHLCVNPPINVCAGGIGTPLVAYGHSHCVLLGILSLGDHCNTPKLPLIFTKVSSFIDEIEKFIEEDFKTMNETTPFEDCYRLKYLHNRQPYYFYPPPYPPPSSSSLFSSNMLPKYLSKMNSYLPKSYDQY